MITKKKLTINDIAALSKVSKSTVSRVLNQEASVNAITRQKVQAVIDEHEFVPSLVARTLKGQTHFVIAVIVTRLDSPSEYLALRSILNHCHNKNIEVLILESLFDSKKLDDHLYALYSRQIAGVIIFSFSHLELNIHSHWQNKLVFIAQAQPDFTSILYDNRGAVTQLFAYFYQQNKRQIAYLGISDHDLSTGKARNQAYLACCKQHQCAPILLQGALNYESGYQLAQQLFAQNPKVEALICATDSLALGALRWLQEHHLSCALGYIGKNAALEFLFPHLVSVDLGFSESGKYAIVQLLTLIRGKKARAALQTHLVPARLCAPSECAPAKS